MRVLAAFVVVGLIALAALISHISGTRIVGPVVTTPDGIKMCIVQQCNWGGEPFTTRFVFRKPGGSWGAFYVGHQDSYWSSSSAVLDTDAHIATFFRGSNVLLKFDWSKEIKWQSQRGAVTGAQFALPSRWSPGGTQPW